MQLMNDCKLNSKICIFAPKKSTLLLLNQILNKINHKQLNIVFFI